MDIPGRQLMSSPNEALNSLMFNIILLHSPLQLIHHKMESMSNMGLERDGESEVLILP